MGVFMRKTTFLITVAGIALLPACHHAPQVAATPQPTAAEIALQRHTQDSLDAVRRASADSVERARQVELANRARADSIEQARVATAAREADEAARKNTELRKELGVMVYFDLAKAEIQPDGRAALDRKVTILKANPNVRLRITGACDERGSDQYNQALGTRRAAAVRQYLVKQGIDAARLDAMSSGEKAPIDSGHGELAWARNRRAEFAIVSDDTPLASAQAATASAKTPPVMQRDVSGNTPPAMAQTKTPPVMQRDVSGGTPPASAQAATASAKTPPVMQRDVSGGTPPASAPQATTQAKTPPVMPHETTNKEQCAMCHGGTIKGITAMPADHKGRGNDVCTLCHAKDSPMQTAVAPAMPHDLAGREQCMTCHGGAVEGVKAAPANHKGIDAKNCTLCHTAAKK
jgi:peptidoglycan-associated lipoprotein